MNTFLQYNYYLYWCFHFFKIVCFDNVLFYYRNYQGKVYCRYEVRFQYHLSLDVQTVVGFHLSTTAGVTINSQVITTSAYPDMIINSFGVEITSESNIFNNIIYFDNVLECIIRQLFITIFNIILRHFNFKKYKNYINVI